MPKILLVEDDPALQFTIQTALEANGYSVDAVSTTGDAIERLAGQAYPIVVTDIYIDERTGLDVLDAAKRKDALCCVILDRKSTRLNSSHLGISYAVFCLKKH